MKKMVVVSLLTLSMAVGSFSCVSAAALDHTSEIAVQSATDSATNNTDALQTEDQTANTDEKVNEMMKSIENTLASSSDDISSDSTTDNGLKYWEDLEKIYCLNYRKGSLYRENI